MFFPTMAAWNIRGFNHPDKVLSCKRLIKSFSLQLVCILENRISSNSLLDPFFVSSHSLFTNEESCNNFTLSSSGRIWVKWDANKICFKPSTITNQLISGTVWVSNQPLMHLSAIYASNQSFERKELWDSLTQISSTIDLPWALIGDFNCCRYAFEESGGNATNQSALLDFNSMIFNNRLMDLSSVGLKYTWFNQRSSNPIHIKLDRVLVNESWLNSFTNSYYAIQNPSCSDHCPIILNSGMTIQRHHRFLFKNFWTKLDQYWYYILEAFSKNCEGNPISQFMKSLKFLKKEIKCQAWSSSTCVSRHLERLNELQLELMGKLQEEPNNVSICQSLKACSIELSRFNSMLSSWTIQRAKVNWIRYGEDDLKFLYAKIKKRRNAANSVVNFLANESADSNSDVASLIIHYFQGLYNPPAITNLNLSGFPVGSKLSVYDASCLTTLVLDEEVKHAVFSGKSNSAPGPDGYNFFFYKSAWHIIAPVVCRAVKSFFYKCYMPNGVKATALAIVPKFKNATDISDYRPIALCNVFYKIITKVLAERMKPLMCLIVKDNQAGFVKSRVSTDNILLASDLLSYAGKKRGCNFFCAKLDIKKAFDSVCREFLLERMLQKGFPSLFVNWIKACIMNVNFSILINGSLEGYFSSSAGLRQGCPLSPYLFCIVMDTLSNLLEQRGFKGISHENFSLSHLLYADDVLIFGEATIENCSNLASILRDFASSTGLNINYDKCSIMFPRNLRNANDICQSLSIHNIVNNITYLGIPLSFYRLKIADFLPLMDSVSKKMNGWKANLLSFAGRLQYIKFTIQNTIAYWIRGAIMPKTVYKFVKRSSSKFLFFGDSVAVKKLQMVAWDKICLPKDKGGLGIPSVNALQFAYKCSVIYRMYNVNSPLSNWLLSLYKSPWMPPPASASKLWKSICKTALDVKHYFNFRITQFAPISLKWDHWCQNHTLTELLGGSYQGPCPDITIQTLISGNQWVFPDNFPQPLRHLIGGISIHDTDVNCLLWKNCNTYKFNRFVEEFYSDFQTCYWHKFIWSKNNILKHSVFAWMALARGLKTADELFIRNIIVPTSCSLCHAYNESVTHLFFECDFTFSVLTAIIPGLKTFLYRPNIMQVFEWIKGKYRGNKRVKHFFYMTVCCVIYHVWKERNGRRFGDTSSCSITLSYSVRRNISDKIAGWKNSIYFLELL
ncbi:Putative ribonuclease H protein [Dendrobium catenatum]|uniref:Ribonuclease H protein n=1 Tax=Dendrobium catenatum TaxID=906689 RepID=A0A2I0XFS5_9ASPA|nr:Putative ribonuclease H protein [Dendrobium catenatum]